MNELTNPMSAAISREAESVALDAVSQFTARHNYLWTIVFEGARERQAVLRPCVRVEDARSYCLRCGKTSTKEAFDWSPDPKSLRYLLARLIVATGGRWSDRAYLATEAIAERRESQKVKARTLELLRIQLQNTDRGFCACGGQRVNFPRPRVRVEPVVQGRLMDIPAEVAEDFRRTVKAIEEAGK